MICEITKLLFLFSVNFNMIFKKKQTGPAVTCTLYHPDLTCPVNLDFTPTLLNIAPLPDEERWKIKEEENRTKEKAWPSPKTIKKIIKMGVCLVPKNEYHWKISTSMLDKTLMEDIKDDHETQGFRRMCHKILKGLTKYFCNTTKPVITSYVLKVEW